MTEYDEGRIWYKKKGKLITLGLTEKAFEDIGDVDGVSLPTDGDEVFQDDVIGEISGTRTNFEVITPVDGAVVAINHELMDHPELIRDDPLDEGWFCQIRMESSEEEEEESAEE